MIMITKGTYFLVICIFSSIIFGKVLYNISSLDNRVDIHVHCNLQYLCEDGHMTKYVLLFCFVCKFTKFNVVIRKACFV